MEAQVTPEARDPEIGAKKQHLREQMLVLASTWLGDTPSR
jgi:hypothetical protein